MTPILQEQAAAQRNHRAIKWWLKSQLTTTWPWAGHLTSLSLSFLVSKKRATKILTSHG